MRRTAFVAILVASVFLVSCGGQQAEQDEETTVVEKTVVRTVEETVEKTVAPTVPSFGATYTPEEQREADEAKAAAVEEEITPEILENVDDTTTYGEQIVFGLLNCQMQKYAADNGQEALDEFLNTKADESMEVTAGEEVTSLQESFMAIGYTCTIPEARASYGG